MYGPKRFIVCWFEVSVTKFKEKSLNLVQIEEFPKLVIFGCLSMEWAIFWQFLEIESWHRCNQHQAGVFK